MPARKALGEWASADPFKSQASRQPAAAAERITELLNAGREYMGPKIMHFDHNRKHAGIDSYFLPAASEEP
ncbi:MAG: hypothetical protein ACO3FM_06105 [Burkholderiaceae bacterium]